MSENYQLISLERLLPTLKCVEIQVQKPTSQNTHILQDVDSGLHGWYGQ